MRDGCAPGGTRPPRAASPRASPPGRCAGSWRRPRRPSRGGCSSARRRRRSRSTDRKMSPSESSTRSRRPRPASRPSASASTPGRPPALRAAPAARVEDRAEQRAHAARHVADHALARATGSRCTMNGASCSVRRAHAAREQALLLGVLAEPLPDGACRARAGTAAFPVRTVSVRSAQAADVDLEREVARPVAHAGAGGRCAAPARCGPSEKRPVPVEFGRSPLSARGAQHAVERVGVHAQPARPAPPRWPAPSASSSATPSSASVPIICVRAMPHRLVEQRRLRRARAGRPGPCRRRRAPSTARTANAGGGRPAKACG